MRQALIALLALVTTAAPAGAATRDVEAPAAARLTLQGATGPVARLGDLNRDGRPDVAAAAPFLHLPGRSSAGTVYVLFGSAASGTVDVEGLGTGGFKIVGGRFYRAGYALAGAGDVNGDGTPDILLSAPRKNGYGVPGSAYVVYGKADAAAIDLTALKPAQGFEIVGVPPQGAATAEDVAGPGDVDGDGLADILLSGWASSAAAAVVYGARRSGKVDLRRLGRRGFRIAGRVRSGSPKVAGPGDVNGDRRGDLVVGGSFRGLGSSVFVVFGRRYRGVVDLRRLGSRGFRIGGLNPSVAIYAPSVAGAGDVNGDRLADVLLVRNPGGSQVSRQEAVVVFGSRSGRAVDLRRLGRRGFRIMRKADQFGFLGAVAGLGDVDGDGIPDLGISNSDFTSDGRSRHSLYVVLGRRATATVDLGDLGDRGFRFTGPEPTCGSGGVGASAALAGDFDGDGRNDLLLGAPGLNACKGQVLLVPAP